MRKINIFRVYFTSIKPHKQQIEKLQNQLLKCKNIIHNQKTQAQLKASILYSQILGKKTPIIIYDNKSHIFIGSCIINIIMGGLVCFLLNRNINTNKQQFLNVLALSSMLLRLFNYYKTSKRTIQTIVYQPQTQYFLLQRRNFWGLKYIIKVHKNRLLYTQEKSLRISMINYINMDNLQQYSVAVPSAWKHKDLFSYLIGQRISTSLL